MINWEQKKLHHFIALLAFLAAVLVCLVEYGECLAAIQTEVDGFRGALETDVKAKKTKDKKLFDLTEAPLSPKNGSFSKNELIIKYKKNSEKNLKPFQIGSDRVDQNKLLRENFSLVPVSDQVDILAETKKINADQNVEFSQPNFQYSEYQIGINDTYRKNLWALDNESQSVNGKKGKRDADIDAPEAWKISSAGKREIVAVIDTGVAFNHPDLRDNMWDGADCVDWEGKFLGDCQHGYDFADNDKIPLPNRSAHGTIISGVIGATRNNNKGVAGISENVKIMALKTNFTTDEIIKAIRFAKNNGAKIINASWGARIGSCNILFDRAMYEEIRDFPGLFVASAGNNSMDHDGQAHFFYPADFSHSSECWEGLENVISVAATDQNNQLAVFSDYGKFVDISAPGENIFSTYVTFGYPSGEEDGSDNNYVISNGTSLSAPFVSGLAAMIQSKKSALKAGEIKKIILESSESDSSLKGKISENGGRLNAYSALKNTAEESPGMKISLDVRVLASDTIEDAASRAAEIRIENPEPVKFYRLATHKKLGKARWRTMPEKIFVPLKKKRSNQNFYLQFKDENGNESDVIKKTFRYRKN